LFFAFFAFLFSSSLEEGARREPAGLVEVVEALACLEISVSYLD